MSIKIRNGNRIFAKSLDEAIATLKAPQQFIKEQLFKLALDDLYTKALDIYDTNILTHTCFRKDEFEDPIYYQEVSNLTKTSLSLAYNALREEHTERMQDRNEELEHQLQIYLYPKKLKENGKSYYLFTDYCNESIKEKYFSQLSNVERYPYWNSSDKPDEITTRQWNRRKKDWKLAMPEGSPIEDGLSIMVGLYPKLPMLFSDTAKEEAKKYFSDFVKELNLTKRKEQYMLSMAVKLVFNQLYKEKDTSVQETMGIYLQARRMAKKEEFSEEQKQHLNKKAQLLETILTDIDYEDLMKPLNEQIEKIKIILMATKLEEEMQNKEENYVTIRPKL